MNPIIEQMLNLQPMETTSDRKNGMKEVIQEIVLSGLSRAGFLHCCLLTKEVFK